MTPANEDENKSKKEIKKVVPKKPPVYKPVPKRKADIIINASRKRKAVRLTVFIVFIAAIIIGCLFGSYGLFKRGIAIVPSGSSLSLNINNCTIVIKDPSNSDTTDMKLSYRLQTNPLPTAVSLSQVYFSEQSPGNFYLNLVNGYSFDYCSLEFFVSSKTTLNSLEIQCTKCYIIQESTILSISNAFILNGQNMYGNFKNINVGTITYTSNTGYLSLDYFQVSPNSRNFITMNVDGDIVLQSNNGFLINYESGTNSFCFAGAKASNSTNQCGGNQVLILFFS